MIPKVLHYCWFGGSDLPAKALLCIESWRRWCPDYEIRAWSETNFDVSQCTFSFEAAGRKEWAFVSDFARLAIIAEHGGVYLDTDVELLKPLNELLEYNAFFGFQHDGTIATGLGFGAVRSNPLVKALAEVYRKTSFLSASEQPDRTPCPNRDALVFERFGFRLDGSRQTRNGVVCLPSDYLCPMSFKTGRVSVTNNTHAIHHFEASWHTPLEAACRRRMRFYCAMLGERIGMFFFNLDRKICAIIKRFPRGLA